MVPAGSWVAERGVALLVLVLAFALAGCMQPSEDDWEPYDSGRGLAFGMLLTVLLLVGVVLLVVNLTASRQPPSPLPPPESMAPPTSGSAAGWEPIEPSAPSAPSPVRRPSAAPVKRATATKTTKPRRPSP